MPGYVTLCPTAQDALGALQLHRRGTGHFAPRDVLMQGKHCTLIGEKISRGRKAEQRGNSWTKVSLGQ